MDCLEREMREQPLFTGAKTRLIITELSQRKGAVEYPE